MIDRFGYAGIYSKMKQQPPLFEPAETKTAPGAICSFCHKQEHEVGFLLLAAVSAVCGECIKLHFTLLCEHEAQQAGGEHGNIDAVHGSGKSGKARKG